MEFAVLGLFCSILILCIVCNASIIYALLAGLVLFSCYARKKGFSVKEILHMAGAGVWKVRNILVTFILIGLHSGDRQERYRRSSVIRSTL